MIDVFHQPPRRLSRATLVYLPVWILWLTDWLWFNRITVWLPTGSQFFTRDWPYWLGFLPAAGLGAAWIAWSRRPRRRDQISVALVATGVFLLWWPLIVFVLDSTAEAVHSTLLVEIRAQTARLGTVASFFVGLAWVVWGLERGSRYYELRRKNAPAISAYAAAFPGRTVKTAAVYEQPRIWNPLDTAAWYYGRRSRKLNQSVTGLLSYSLMFMLAFFVFTHVGGCSEVYEMPAGGGQERIQQMVHVQKVIRKKYVVNPLSAISFKIPTIDEINNQLDELTAHQYTIGYGEGTSGGFSQGTMAGKVRFIRLEYSGGDWDQDFGVGADENILNEYGIRTQQKTENKTESRTIPQLARFEIGKSPPMVFMTGQKGISVSDTEVRILREYLLDKHGMLFIDNGGSSYFGRNVRSMMSRVLPNVRPVPIPLDDRIHRVPYAIPFLPYVAPHDGKVALGWKVDGRWVCYYHPGDIADAWADGHAGVKPEVWEACYQLGSNIIFYAHAEYNKWLEARKEK